MSTYTMRRLLCVFIFSLTATLWAEVPAVGTESGDRWRILAPRILISADHSNWNYQTGETCVFRIQIVSDGGPIGGIPVSYKIGPEEYLGEEHQVIVPREGLKIEAALHGPGFLRCIVTATIDGREYRALSTAAYRPVDIKPTQVNPDDFDEFWARGISEQEKIPLDLRTELIPEQSKGNVDVFQVSFRTWPGAAESALAARFYGILCVPKKPGKYPALLTLPGAGVRSYRGLSDFAAAGAITLQVGIHGIPVNLPQEVYDQLSTGALRSYPTSNLDDRESYYYRRVYLGCLRGARVLAEHPMWDGKNLLVTGGSQGGQLAIVVSALEPRVTQTLADFPAYCDVSGYGLSSTRVMLKTASRVEFASGWVVLP